MLQTKQPYYLFKYFLFLGLESVTNCTLFFVSGSENSTFCFSSCSTLGGVFLILGISSISSLTADSSVSMTTLVLLVYGTPNSSLLKLIIEQNPSDDETTSN